MRCQSLHGLHFRSRTIIRFMKYYTLMLLTLLAYTGLAQEQKYDLLTFTPPTGWTKTTMENVIGFSVSDNKKNTWAQISIVKSTASKGSIDNDFISEWKELAVKPYKVSDQPVSIDKQVFNGWKVWTGLGKFDFNGQTVNLLLTTFSDGQRCVSFILMSNTTQYGIVLDEFVGSVKIPPVNVQDDISTPVVVNDPSQKSTGSSKTSGANTSGNFEFTITNFDDGWTSVAKEDWVEASKGTIRVLLHYPRKEDAEYISQQDDHTRMFWNLLIAPRYTNASNFFLYEYNNIFEPGHLAYGNLIDSQGQKQFVALFMKGKSGWIEIITPDKATFVNAFGVDQPDSHFSNWELLSGLSRFNRFAVAEKDLTGKWSSDFSGSLQYYSTFTGMYAGYNAFSSRVEFVFRENKSYDWKLGMANSTNGQTAAQSAESSGTFSMKGNWQMVCSKIQDGPRTYNVFFSCIKGGRVLWLQDVDYGSYTAYGKVAK